MKTVGCVNAHMYGFRGQDKGETATTMSRREEGLKDRSTSVLHHEKWSRSTVAAVLSLRLVNKLGQTLTTRLVFRYGMKDLKIGQKRAKYSR